MTGASLSVTGVVQAQLTLRHMMELADAATRRGVAESLAAIKRQAQLNSDGRPGPNVRSGAHRASFTVDGPRTTGLGRWEGSCGPTMRYSRRLELGGGNWPPGLRFPSLGPAVAFCNKVVIPQVMRGAWAQAVVV